MRYPRSSGKPDRVETEADGTETPRVQQGADEVKQIKCVVWDLDNTLWNGVLSEGDALTVREGVVDVIKALDSRGVLQSIASRNEETAVLTVLQRLGLVEYFLHPQISWGAKHGALCRISTALNIGLDTFLFIDDEAYEREWVGSALPGVRVVDAAEIATLLQRPDLPMGAATDEARGRRLMYQQDVVRTQAQENFDGPTAEFIASLDSIYTFRPAEANDLQRAGELTVRTSQLNATGYTYSPSELDAFRRSDTHTLLVMDLTDRFGALGTIGLLLIERKPNVWTIKLLLSSCRAMARGAGTVLLRHVIERSIEAGVSLRSEFVRTDRNRIMFLAYRLGGFRDLEPAKASRMVTPLTGWQDDEGLVMVHDGVTLPTIGPATIISDWA